MEHELKILPIYYEDVKTGKKTFELRKNDRDFHLGDKIILREWSKDKGYTGREMEVYITYMLQDFEGITPGYCVLGINTLGFAMAAYGLW